MLEKTIAYLNGRVVKFCIYIKDMEPDIIRENKSNKYHVQYITAIVPQQITGFFHL